MSSNMRIPKVCQYCNSEFTAQKLTTKFCSLKCAQRSYKKVKREEKVESAHKEYIETKKKPQKQPLETILVQKPYLGIKEACKLLNASDTTIRKAIKDGTLKTIRIGKKHIIRREDIEKLFQIS